MPWLASVVNGYHQAQRVWYQPTAYQPTFRETCWREKCRKEFVSATGLCAEHLAEMRSWS